MTEAEARTAPEAEAGRRSLPALLRGVAGGSDDQVLTGALPLLCTALGFEVGHVYAVENQSPRSVSWHLADARFEPFRAVTPPGRPEPKGVVVAALASGQPVWLEEMRSNPVFLRSRAAEVTGLRSGVCLPLRVDGETLAVLELFSTQPPPIPPDAREALVDSTDALGEALLAARRQSSMRSAARLWRATFDGPQPVAVLGSGLEVVEANPALRELLGTEPSKMAGLSLVDLGASEDDREVLGLLAARLDRPEATGEPAGVSCTLRDRREHEVEVGIRAWLAPAEHGEAPRLICLITPMRQAAMTGRGGRFDEARAVLSELPRIRDLERLIPVAIACAARLSGDYAGLALLQPEGGGYASYHHTTADGYAVELQSDRVARMPILDALRQEDRPIRVAKVSDHPLFVGFPPGQPAPSAFLGVALRAAGQTVGHLLLARREPEPFSDQEEAVAAEIAAVIAQVVRLVRAEDRISVLRTRAQRLVRANLALMRQVRPEGVAQWSVNDLRTTVDAEYAALLVSGPEDDGAPSFVHSGLARGRAAAVAASRPEARGLLGAAMLTRRPMRLADLRDHPTHSPLPDGHPEMTSFVSAPVIRQGEVIGLLFATNKRGDAEFSPDDEAFVAQMATELGRSRLLGAEPAPADVMERLVVASRSLRHQMDATRSFLGSLSHELRGAISGILISAELLTDPSLGTLGEEQVRVLATRIHSVAGNLLTLVDNLLDLGQLEAGRLDIQLQPVDLPAVLHDVEDVVKPLADRAGVSLEWPPLTRVPRVVADPVRLRQVLVNLMTNAVKFTPGGGRAWLEITPDAETVSLAVCDTGRGVVDEDRERIFEPFARSAQAGIDHVPGVGLGLAICRRVTELHGSRLELVSEPGLGSRFSFALRRSREPLPPRLLRPPGGEIEVAGRDGPPLSVLLVEDDPVHRQSMSDVLTAAGYVVRAVGTRSAALESAGRHGADLVILDVQLPDGDGLEIVETLRSTVTRSLAVVVVSADRVGDVVERAARAGCDRFALKPVPARELLALVGSALVDVRAGI